MTTGQEGTRSDDTAMLKAKLPTLLNKDGTVALDPPLPSLKFKLHRGFAHATFARALTPMEWAATQM